MRVHRYGLVRPFERGPVGHVVGIEADVAVRALEARRFNPVGDHPQLGRAVAILAGDPGVDALVEADDRAGADHVVEAEPLGDRVGVKPVRRGREHEPPPFALCRARSPPARQDGCSSRPAGRRSSRPTARGRAGGSLRPSSSAVVDLLEPRAVDQARGVSEHRQRDRGQEEQPPRRAAQRAVEQERRVGRRAA